MTVLEFRSTRKFINTDQGRIAYVDRGEGPAALFLHGFPLNSFQWRGVIPQLSATRRCVAPDLLALGYSEVAAGQSVAPHAQVDMLAQLLNKLSIPSADIVANDSGGAIAQLFVTRYPDRARSLLLTNCDTEPDSPPPAILPVIELARAGKFADEWLVPWLADKALARSEKGFGGQCYANPANPTDEAIENLLGASCEFAAAEGADECVRSPSIRIRWRGLNLRSSMVMFRRGSYGELPIASSLKPAPTTSTTPLATLWVRGA
jgi:pimeloyl-ACP methyl ester carboxylesterase